MQECKWVGVGYFFKPTRTDPVHFRFGVDWLGFDFPSKIDQPLEFEERGCERVKRISTKIWFSFRLLVLIKTIRTELVRFDSSFYTLPLCINRFESKSLNGASRLSLPPLPLHDSLRLCPRIHSFIHSQFPIANLTSIPFLLPLLLPWRLRLHP